MIFLQGLWCWQGIGTLSPFLQDFLEEKKAGLFINGPVTRAAFWRMDTGRAAVFAGTGHDRLARLEKKVIYFIEGFPGQPDSAWVAVIDKN